MKPLTFLTFVFILISLVQNPISSSPVTKKENVGKERPNLSGQIKNTGPDDGNATIAEEKKKLIDEIIKSTNSSAEDASKSVEEKMKEFGAKAAEKAKEFGREVEEKTREFGEKAKDFGEKASEKVKDAGADFISKAKDFSSAFKSKASSSSEETEESTTKSPIIKLSKPSRPKRHIGVEEVEELHMPISPTGGVVKRGVVEGAAEEQKDLTTEGGPVLVGEGVKETDGTPPTPIAQVNIDKTKGKCRSLDSGLRCLSLTEETAQCKTDAECPGTKKCCFYGCPPNTSLGICEMAIYSN